jgi:L-threonylcarbamoyladenylate synthase
MVMERPAWITVIRPAQEEVALEEALRWLRQGEIIAFPTDTVYGLGAPMDNPAAVEGLFQVKERPRELSIPLLLAEAGDLERVCRDVPPAAWDLAERFWPGGLTLVLWRRPLVPPAVVAGRPSVAVRLPDHPLPRELSRRLEVPLAATSANLSGEPDPVTAAAVVAQLGGRIPLVLDGGPCPQAQASTIVDLTADPPLILREGPVSRAEIAAVLGYPLGS